MTHGGTRGEGTLCGKPVARRWWTEWPPKPTYGKIANLVVMNPGPRTPREAGIDCEDCLAKTEKR